MALPEAPARRARGPSSAPRLARASLTQRARRAACRRVGRDGQAVVAVAVVARDPGAGCQNIMQSVLDHGCALVDDPPRRTGVGALRMDETAFLRANR